MGNRISNIRETNEEKGEYVHKHTIGNTECIFKFATKSEENNNMPEKGDAGGVLIDEQTWITARCIREFARLLELYEVRHALPTKSQPTMSEEEFIVPPKTALQLKMQKKQDKLDAFHRSDANLQARITKLQEKIATLSTLSSNIVSSSDKTSHL